MLDPLPGDIFRSTQVLNNTYEIEGVLGRGGTGEVYCARNQITGRVVAVKALNRAFSANDAYVELMRREEEMRDIVSEAVVRYTDCARSAEGHVYLVMDYIDGTPLSDLLERGGAAPRDLLLVADRVAEGLVATHSRGIVHRDLSPENIVLRGGDPSKAVIIDFGIAKDTSAGARTIVGNDFAGKYEYAAPEQMHGRAEPRSDLYALGASLLATFRGRIPELRGSPGAVLQQKEQPLDTEGVPEPLKGVIDALTQPDPARRPPNAVAVATWVKTLLAERRPPRRRGLLTAALAFVAALGLAAVYFAMRPGEPEFASPYLLEAARDAEGESSLSGNAPDAAGRDAVLDAFAAAAGGRPAPEALTLARGEPIEDWPQAAAALLATTEGLEDWRLALADRDARLSGVAPDAQARDATAERFAATAAGAGLAPHTAIAAGPRLLALAVVEEALRPLEDCGPLVVTPPGGAAAFPLGATIVVTGAVSTATRLEAIRGALAALAGDRTLRTEVAPRGLGSCAMAGLLRADPGDPTVIELDLGNRDAADFAGQYLDGDNPVADVLLPAETTGYLWVTLTDVGGSVLNLLPNVARPDSALAGLGTVEGGTRRVRVLYSEAELDAVATAPGPAIGVEARFPESFITVFRTDRPLFDGLRPGEESLASFTEELKTVESHRLVSILAVTTRKFHTSQR